MHTTMKLHFKSLERFYRKKTDSNCTYRYHSEIWGIRFSMKTNIMRPLQNFFYVNQPY